MSLRNLLLTEPTQFQDRQEKTSLGDSWQQELPMSSGSYLYFYAGFSSPLIVAVIHYCKLFAVKSVFLTNDGDQQKLQLKQFPEFSDKARG